MHAAFMKSNLNLGVERGKRLEPMHSTLIGKRLAGGARESNASPQAPFLFSISSVREARGQTFQICRPRHTLGAGITRRPLRSERQNIQTKLPIKLFTRQENPYIFTYVDDNSL
jgi:hypothetical protein